MQEAKKLNPSKEAEKKRKQRDISLSEICPHAEVKKSQSEIISVLQTSKEVLETETEQEIQPLNYQHESALDEDDNSPFGDEDSTDGAVEESIASADSQRVDALVEEMTTIPLAQLDHLLNLLNCKDQIIDALQEKVKQRGRTIRGLKESIEYFLNDTSYIYDRYEELEDARKRELATKRQQQKTQPAATSRTSKLPTRRKHHSANDTATS